MSSPFDTLTVLRDEWRALHPLSVENEARLWKKLRLEWNYHSNHIEGNTLTYGETELLLLYDRTTGNHSHREYLEMKAHDVGIEHVRALAEDKARLLTEGDIRDLNQIILKESFWKPAETADGQSARKEIIPGQYKTTPNNVRLPNGDIFFFASVEDTSPRMSDLAAWLRQELASPTLHPVAFAAKLHHDFVCIHSFDDGNGRVARLLVNYVLMRSGYLPLIVRTEDKAGYLNALHLADAGELSALIEYFCRLAEWSLNLGIKAAQGGVIEEISDVEKEVAIFVRNQQARKNGDTTVTRAMIQELMTVSLKSFVERVEAKLKSLMPLFRTTRFIVRNGSGFELESTGGVPLRETTQVGPGEQLIITFFFRDYQGDAPTAFNLHVSIGLHFPPGKYTLTHDGRVIASHDYATLVLSDEAEQLSSQILAEAFDRIKKQSGI